MMEEVGVSYYSGRRQRMEINNALSLREEREMRIGVMMIVKQQSSIASYLSAGAGRERHEKEAVGVEAGLYVDRPRRYIHLVDKLMC